MSADVRMPVRNRLLRALPPAVFDALRVQMERVRLPAKHVLVESGVAVTHVCFIENGLCSVLATSTDNKSVEIGHVGREGVTGASVLLGTATIPHRAFMQVDGNGILVPVPHLLAVLDANPQARDIFMRYIYCSEVQLAHSALANARYTIHERLARWLLMCHDRIDGDDVPLTHEFLALLLGVRRSGVTNELHILEGIHAIRATRGNVRILDRSKLEEIAGGCYGVPESEYERLIGRQIREEASNAPSLPA